MSILRDVVHSIQGRHRELVAWFRTAPLSEQNLRLGPSKQSGAESQISSLGTAIERSQKNELGRCTVCHETVDEHLLQMDYASSVCLDHLSPEERSRLEGELELAVKVQRALLPHTLPSIRGWEIAAFIQPASIVGGDYFDFVTFGDGAGGIIIADVMGKGMPASMLMANLQASIRIIVPESNSPKQVVERINRLFRHNILLTKFVSLFVGHLNPESGSMSYVNAGHNPPLAAHASPQQQVTFTQLFPTGPAIGLVENAAFEVRDVSFQQGSVLTLYTDGIVEGRSSSGEEFGIERLKETIAGNIGRPVQRITSSIQDRLRTFAGSNDLHDDATLVVLRRTGSTEMTDSRS
jgi:sigma-B regulation protein RsbU (phosphoserine phosphatase)